MLLKSPIASKCTEAGVKGCDEITEGAIKYLGGEKEEGGKSIVRGVAKNDPKDTKTFAEALRLVAYLPGASDYKIQLNEVADLLCGVTPSPTASGAGDHPAAADEPTQQNQSTDRGRVPSATGEHPATTSDAGRARTRAGTASFKAGKPCTTKMGPSLCINGPSGPVTLNMVFAGGGCSADMLVFAWGEDEDSPLWFASVPASSQITIQRLGLPVAAEQRITFALALPGDVTAPTAPPRRDHPKEGSSPVAPVIPGDVRADVKCSILWATER